jgi:1-acyl-sn-glycerol-3-phosphate acyltransferase
LVNAVVVAVGLVVVLPLIVVAEQARRGAGRRVAEVAVRTICRLCGVNVVVLGRERLVPGTPYVFVPNHSSPADIPAMIIAAPHARFLAAAELFRIPMLGRAMRAIGSVPIDRRHPGNTWRQIADLTVTDTDGDLVVFAEGLIPPPGELPRFKTGPFVLAIQTHRPVVPVSISNASGVMPRGRWLRVFPGVITVELHDPIDTASLRLSDRRSLRTRTEAVVRGDRSAPT